MTQPTFKVGDKVRHRASGRVAVVTHVYCSCVAHSPFPQCGSLVRPVSEDCDFQPTGRVDLSFDFCDELDDVSGVSLEMDNEMTQKTIELTDEIDQSDPVGYLVASAGGDIDSRVFTDLVEAESYAADQQEEAKADGWPIYPLFAGRALGHISGEIP